MHMIRHYNIFHDIYIIVGFINFIYLVVYDFSEICMFYMGDVEDAVPYNLVFGKFYAWNAEGGVPYIVFMRKFIKRIIVNYLRQIMHPVFSAECYKIQTVGRIIIILQSVQFSVMFLHEISEPSALIEAFSEGRR